jgi:flagellin
MPINSIVTNSSALTALQGLNSTNKMLEAVQKKVNTGYRVNDAKDDGASFAIAEGLRGNIKGLEAVTEQLSKAKGTVGVALEAMNRISNTMKELENVLVKLADENVAAGSDQRTQYENDYEALVNEIKRFAGDAEFGGVNLLTATAGVSVIGNLDGTTTIDLTQYDLTNAGANGAGPLNTFLGGDLTAGTTTPPADASAAQESLNTAGATTVPSDVFAEAKAAVGDVLATLGQESRSLDNQISYVGVITDATEVGVGDIVDADVAAASAELQSLQIRQQLATQTLSIANQGPQVLLGLFQ